MKPTKMRNKMIHRAANAARSRQVGAALSKDLRKKYGVRSSRLAVGDSVKVVRGEFAGVDGKVSKVSVSEGTVAIEGLKKEKTKGDKYDVYIHASNIVITSINTEDWWRTARLEGKDPKDRDLRRSRSEDAAPDDESGGEEDDEEGAEAGEEPGEEPDKRGAAEEKKRPAEQKKAGQKKQKDKKRQENAEEDEDDYDDYEEDED